MLVLCVLLQVTAAESEFTNDCNEAEFHVRVITTMPVGGMRNMDVLVSRQSSLFRVIV